MISEKLSSSSGSLALSKHQHSVSSVDNARRHSFDSMGNEIEILFSEDQNCHSIDSHMSKLRIPPWMRNLTKLVMDKENV